MSCPEWRISRRDFLRGAAGIGALAVAPLSACTGPGERVLQDHWLFGPFVTGCTDRDFDDSGLTPVRLPHCVARLSWWKWDPESWNDRWIYRQHIRPSRERQRTVLHFDGVLSAAAVSLNGQEIGVWVGGYLPFEFELTDYLIDGDNVIAVAVDSRWGLDVPPGRPSPWRARSIDFYQPGGIPRNAEVRQLPDLFLSDVHAVPVDVLTAQRRVDVSGVVDVGGSASQVSVTAQLMDSDNTIAKAQTTIRVHEPGDARFRLSLRDLGEIRLWDVDSPNLYNVVVTATVHGRKVHETSVRIGFREARFTLDGFYLNGRRVQLFGLNRHEWYPYVGAAMPDRVHRRDAEILKNDLNCTMVRCSHYPQSEAFLDACDELGLLVWEEAPGWDYIGGPDWRAMVVRDVETMVRRDRNHPSIIIWGTRLNETEDDIDLYTQTHAVAKRLDGTRATTGAVNVGIHGPGPEIPTKYRDPFATSPQVQDVFALNDYARPSRGQLPTLHDPRTNLPYIVSEAIGVLAGSPHFRRTDSVAVQAEQAMMHASVQDKAMSNPRYCGLLAWCAFDYPSAHGKAFDGVKWAGVVDIFREPKPGAAFYRAQVDPARRVVIEPAFYWDSRTVPGKHAVIWSNCERLDVFVDERRVATLSPDRSSFPHLPYPPFLVDLPAVSGDLRIDGWVGGALVLSRSFSPDRTQDRLQLAADDVAILADGVDATRVVVSIVDRYGARRALAGGRVSFSLAGPGELIGDNPLDVTGNAGVGAVWVRSRKRDPGQIVLTAHHQQLGLQTVMISTQ